MLVNLVSVNSCLMFRTGGNLDIEISNFRTLHHTDLSLIVII